MGKSGGSEDDNGDTDDFDPDQPLKATVAKKLISEILHWESGDLRYRVETHRMGVVVSFRSKTSLVVVTGWRNRT